MEPAATHAHNVEGREWTVECGDAVADKTGDGLGDGRETESRL